jgi:ribonuclease HI
MGKVMEQMVLNRLKHIVGPLHPNLMGCTQGKGTTDAIATLANIVSDVKHRRSGPCTKPLKAAYAIFIDYMKAFELANSSVVLSILCEEKGVVGNLLGWLQDFLTDRTGYTTILGQKSDTMPFYQGTPQGSVLSPFLFNILMDKLIRTIYSQLPVSARSKVTILSYADDIVLVCNNFAAKDLLGLALRTLEYASTILGLQVNVTKTKAMAWNHSQKFPNFHFQIYDGPIEWVRKFKYLGVTFDDTLSFVEHVEDVVSRVNSRINVLKHLAGCPYGATQKTLLTYYKSCIRPILEYGSVIVCIACPTAISRLESIQNTALKIALRLPRQARTQLVLAESGCTPIEDRCKFLAATAISKIKYPGSNHPYLQSGKEMHMDPDMLGKRPLYDSDIPLDMVLTNLSQQIGLLPLQITPVVFPNPIHPTTLQKVSVDLTALEMPKHLFSLEQKVTLREKIEAHINTTYSDHLEVYVDGSLDPITGRASAAYTSIETDLEAGIRITNHVCSTQAEMAAIHLTLEKLLSTNISFSKVVIHCDSQAAIKTLQRSTPDPLDQISTQIVSTLSKLMSRPYFHLTIHWIPSHIGIPGNEKADRLCEKARSLKCISYHIPMSFGQVKSMSRRYFSEKLKKQVMSSSSESVKSYLQLNPYLKPQGDLTSNPVVQLWINRLRLQTEEYCYIHKTRKVCFFCKEHFTSAHYLVECPVTASPSFREFLTEDEHSFQPIVQAQKILSKLHFPRAMEIFSKHIIKRPPKISCSNPQHGILRYFDYHL